LVGTASQQNFSFMPQLGLAYLAGSLRAKGHSVNIICRDIFMLMNRRDYRKVDELTIKALKDFQPQLVGIGATTTLINDAYRVARLSKGALPGIPVVVGGPHASVLPSQTLEECADIDMVVRGEGENTMLDLAAGSKLNEIDGITFRDGHKFYTNKDRVPIEDLDVLPFPARDLLGMDFYLKSRGVFLGLDLREAHILTMRGCPYRCSFCATLGVFKKGVRFHSVDYVVKEVRHLISDYRIEGLYFVEDCFLANRKRAEMLCKRLIAEGINKSIVWGTQIRADSVDEDILRLMKQAGCVQVEYGFESGSQRILEEMNKSTHLNDNLRAVRITQKVGMSLKANILVGFPGEREEDLLLTKKFLRDSKPDKVYIHRFAPMPGSRSFEELKNKGLIKSGWDNLHVGNTKDPELNFTQMETGHLFLLIEDLQRFAFLVGLKSYLIANFKLHPLRLLRKIWMMALRHPGRIFTYLGRLSQAFFSRL